MAFIFKQMPMAGLILIERQAIKDARGQFSEGYKASEFHKAGIMDVFLQDNQSISHKNVLRGLHYQKEPYAQAKLVSCLHGEVFDVAVDLRKDSPTYGCNFGVSLSPTNGLMLYIPAGFAHGFYAFADNSVLSYKCSKEYMPSYETGIKWNDSVLDLAWPVPHPHVSDKDSKLPSFKSK